MMGRKDKKSSSKLSSRGYSGAWRTNRQKSTNPNSECPPVPGMISLCPLLSVTSTECDWGGNSWSKKEISSTIDMNYEKYMSNLRIDRIIEYYLRAIENSLSVYMYMFYQLGYQSWLIMQCIDQAFFGIRLCMLYSQRFT